MKNNAFLLTFLLIIAFFMFSACLDQVNFDPDSVYNTNVTGDINTTDVTSAVLMLTNRSKTVDVTKVSISQPEWAPPEGSPWAQAPGVSFANRPKRLERKAQYLSPSDKSYQITIDFAFDAYEDSPAGTGTKTLTIPLPLPRQIVELFIYRDKDGVTIIDKDVIDPVPDDTGNPAVDPSPGEGSSPAVIPPEYRNRMATFVVINKTNSQIIDGAEFKMGRADYVIGKIGITDKQSIALGQGTWETTVTYTLNNKLITVGPKNSVVVPSNDPQSVREHYLYFYKTKRGDYNISQEWPPYPADADEEDMLPPDLNGKGRGLIKIINNSYSLAKMVTILNLRDGGVGPMTIYYPEFSPPVPVQYSKTGYVNVVGTNAFPIDAHEDYLIQITLEGSDSLATVERKAYIKDQVVTIVIAPDDLKETKAVGATVTLQNRVTSWPVTITSMIVRNKASAQSSVYGIYTWQPSGVINNNNSAVQFVVSSAAMPIIKGDLFEAVIVVHGNGKTDYIIKDFSPAELYSEKPPEQNTRTLTITDIDVPDGLKETFVPVSLIKLGKEVINVDLKNGVVASDGMLNLKNYTTVLLANATVQGPVIWELVNSGNAILSDPALIQTSGIIDINGRTTPSTGSSSTTIEVKATIQNAAGNLFNRTDYAKNFSITVNFSDLPPASNPDVWADSISITGGDLAIKVGEYRNLSGLVKINPSTATVTNDDIVWSIVGSGAAYFSLNGPIITGKAVGTGIVRVVLPAAKNGGTERRADLNVTVTPNNEEITDPDDGRILTPPQTGDSENWIEIARNGDYSLIVRARYINIYPNHKNDPSWNYTAFGWNNAYGNSTVRKRINEFFNGTSAVENLPSGARLRNFTVKNNAANILGTSNSKVGLTDGFSKPTDTRAPSGDDVAFALSYGEAANFCSRTRFIRDMSPNIQNSPDVAVKNYNKINIPTAYIYGMWLRSPGDVSATAAAITNINDYGRVFQFRLDGNNTECGLVYPAVWVHKDIFK